MWFYPSRGRPKECASLLSEIVKRGSKAPGVVLVNADDPTLFAYQAIRLPPGWEMTTIPEGYVGMGEKLRRAFTAYPRELWYGWLADDVLVATDGFEQSLVAAAGAWSVSGANDIWLTRSDVRTTRILSGITVIGGDLARAVGYLVPEGFVHLFVDNVWETIARGLNNWRFLPNVYTPNNHPVKTGNEAHPVTAAVNTKIMFRSDQERFNAWRAEEADDVIHRARMAMWEAEGLSLELAKSRSVCFGLPVFDKVHPKHVASLVETAVVLTQLGITCGHSQAVGQPHHRARNGIVTAFLASPFTDLIFIDADMSWNPWDVVRLLASPHEVVAGVGRKRAVRDDNDPKSWCFEILEDEAPVRAGAISVAHVGTGFMRISRSALGLLAAARPEYLRDVKDRKPYWRFFFWDDDGVTEHGEDVTFCREYRKVGGSIWADLGITLNHYGDCTYSGSVLSLFE